MQGVCNFREAAIASLATCPTGRSPFRSVVGLVERSETHQASQAIDGFRSALPILRAGVAHADEPAKRIVTVAHHQCRRGRCLGDQAVERVVGEGDGAIGAGLAREHVAVGVASEGLNNLLFNDFFL